MSRHVVVLTALIAAIAFTGCKKQQPPPTPAPAPAPIVEPPPPAPEPPKVETAPRSLERVRFQYDSTSVTSGTTASISSNTEILQDFPNTRVEIQGHADERGTTEYNLALGQRRAEAVKERMSRMGVSTSRMSTISYGEERPLERGSNESAWSANRRAEFRVLSHGENEPVQGTVP